MRYVAVALLLLAAACTQAPPPPPDDETVARLQGYADWPTSAFPEGPLREARIRLIEDADAVPDAMLARLAALDDGLAAVTLARRIETTRPVEAIRLYAIAARRGRDYAVRPMIALLKAQSSLPAEVRAAAATELERRADLGEPLSTEALGRFYADGRPLGHRPLAAARYLGQAQATGAAGIDRLALDAARAALADPGDRAGGAPIARAYLRLAAQSGDLGTRVTAENLLALLQTRTEAPA